MRLPVEIPTLRSSLWLTRSLGALALAAVLSGCGMMGGGSHDGGLAAVMPVNGPQADYPVEVGEPYQIAGVNYRPSDTLNYDEVGYVAVDSGAMGITGSHHTLPVPSYAEVTSLTTGRTILVRLERRGPMSSNHLLSLSPAALAQLDATSNTPVRVRRVNAPEEQRMMLRSGQSAPLRMDTPMSLVSVLRRRLPDMSANLVPQPEPALANAEPAPVAPEPLSLPPVVEQTSTGTTARGAPPPLPPLAGAGSVHVPVSQAPARANPHAAAAPAIEDGFVVQAAAFSTEDRARRAANILGGTVSRSGNFYRVRTGPFPTRVAAEASLANVRAAGYSDARIFSDG